MSGLLRRVQKKKSRRLKDVTDVLYQEDIEDDGTASKDTKRGGDTLHDSRWREPSLLGRVVDSASALDKETDARAERILKVVRRRGQSSKNQGIAKQRDSDLPAWMAAPPGPSAHLDELIEGARRQLAGSLAEMTDEAAVADLVREAVKANSSTLRDRFRITHRMQEHAREELLGILEGKGVLRPLFEDDLVTDVFVDAFDKIRVTRGGCSMMTPLAFRCREEYALFLQSLMRHTTAKCSREHPVVDAVLDDEWNSRVSILHNSLTDSKEPHLCFRIPRQHQITFYELIQAKTVPASIASWLSEVVSVGALNVMVAGPAGSGKTAFLNALLSAVGSDERVIVVEDLPELSVTHPNIERLISRPADVDTGGEFDTSALLKIALRRAPHRIVLGQVSEEAAGDFLRTLEMGNFGSMGTIVAGSSVDALWKFFDLVSCRESMPRTSLVRRISRSLNIIILLEKIDGSSCLVEIAEVMNSTGDEFKVTPLASYSGAESGKRRWKLRCRSSASMDLLRSRGFKLKPGGALLPPDQAA